MEEKRTGFRLEHDSIGDIEVVDDKYWGAQTQRSLMNFPIGTEKMPKEIINAFLLLKKACAIANMSYGKLDELRGNAITTACNDFKRYTATTPIHVRHNIVNLAQ